MNAAPNIFARVRIGQTSHPQRDSQVVVPVDCPAVYDASPPRAARLAAELTVALVKLEDACVRAREQDTDRSYWWVCTWALLCRRLEVEMLVACGTLPISDAEVG